MGLLLLVDGAQLDDGRTRVGQGQQDLLPIAASARHLGLRGEDEWPAPLLIVGDPAARKERQRGEAEDQFRRVFSGDSGELGDLTAAVQQEEVAAAPDQHGSVGGRDADPRQPCDQDRAGAAAEQPMGGDRRDHRPGAREQDGVRSLEPEPVDHRSVRQHLDRFAGRCPDLLRRRADRAVDHDLSGPPASGHRPQGRHAPLQIRVGVRHGHDRRAAVFRWVLSHGGRT